MFKIINKLAILSILYIFIFSINSANADISEEAKKENKKNKNEILRNPTGVFDNQLNSVSNIQFFTSNYGIFGLDVARLVGGGFWPRGSQNQYIFGGGVWFGAQKQHNPQDPFLTKYCVLSYNPNDGQSWFVPGRINDEGCGINYQDNYYMEYDPTDTYSYRAFFSTDFTTTNGVAFEYAQNSSFTNWPIWDASSNPDDTLKFNRYFGNYIPEQNDRNISRYPKGPAFISGEDIFSTYKDTDLSVYPDGADLARQKGYPLTLQVEQMIYSWGFGDYKDFIFIKYSISNFSSDTLWNCWLAPVQDVDLARAPNTSFGAGNDRATFFEDDPELNLAYQWTNVDRGEAGHGFGYLGFSFLESPAVNKCFDTIPIFDTAGVIIDYEYFERPCSPNYPNEPLDYGPDGDILLSGFVRKDSAFYHGSSQLGLVTFRNWNIEEDPLTDESRYDFISAGIRDGDTGPGDKRFMMSTGPFHVRPCDTVRTVVGIILASTAKGGEADGTAEDAQELIRKTIFAQSVYDNNFRAPEPPHRSRFLEFEPLNNGVIVRWDSTAEVSIDPIERGLDFMGYRLYRARRTNLDTFNLNSISATTRYPRGVGPFGWKQIAHWSIPSAFHKSVYRGGHNPNDLSVPLIDSLRIIGPYVDGSNRILDSMAIKIMRVPRGVTMTNDSSFIGSIIRPGILMRNDVTLIDTTIFSKPWGPYYHYLSNVDADKRELNINVLPFQDPTIKALIYSPSKSLRIFDEVMVGTAYLNRALLAYNPLYYRTINKDITLAHLENIRTSFPDLMVGKIDTVDGTPIRTTIDSVFLEHTLKYINSHNMWTIDVKVPRNMNNIMNDYAHVQEILQTLYSYIQNGLVELDFPDFEQSNVARNQIIMPYMRQITNNRTFIDVGDDNGDGTIEAHEDPKITERLINNIEYHYRLIAYDEGDFTQPTEGKANDASPGLPNLITTVPTAAKVSDRVTFEIIEVDSSKVGGLFNFQFFAVDEDRVMQNFAGDTLVLEFEPSWRQIYTPFEANAQPYSFGIYSSNITLKRESDNKLLYDGTYQYELRACSPNVYEWLTEDAASVVWDYPDKTIINEVTGQEITFHKTLKGKEEIRPRTGTFSTGNFNERSYCYAMDMLPPAYGALGFSFDFALEQHSGKFSPDSLTLDLAKTKFGTNANTPIHILGAAQYDGDKENKIHTSQVVAMDYNRIAPMFGSFNNGPGDYIVTFLNGGKDTLNLAFGNPLQTKEFVVEYLDVDIENVREFSRPNPSGGEPIKLTPTGKLKHIEIQSTPMLAYTIPGTNTPTPFYEREWPDPRNLGYNGNGFSYYSYSTLGIDYKLNTNKFIGNYNLAAYGFVDLLENSNLTVFFPRFKARPNEPGKTENLNFNTGKQGRYYLSGKSLDGVNTIHFSHILNISGANFILDYANSGKIVNRNPAEGAITWTKKSTSGEDAYVYGTDFKAGEQIFLKTRGGVAGLPAPGAKVRVKISDYTPENRLSDKLMDQITVAPNPYYIAHQGVKSPYDANKIFFNKLPKRCTIDIYTVTGDLIKTLEHNEYDSEAKDRTSVQVWDLLSKNQQRVQSQSMVAVITTPDGAQTVKNFSVVVGGFRLIQD